MSRLNFTRDLRGFHEKTPPRKGEPNADYARRVELAGACVVIDERVMKSDMRTFIRLQDLARRKGVPLVCPPAEGETLDPVERVKQIASAPNTALQHVEEMRRAERDPIASLPRGDEVTPESMARWEQERNAIAEARKRLGMPS